MSSRKIEVESLTNLTINSLVACNTVSIILIHRPSEAADQYPSDAISQISHSIIIIYIMPQ
jgi:hypothetical protein